MEYAARSIPWERLGSLVPAVGRKGKALYRLHIRFRGRRRTTPFPFHHLATLAMLLLLLTTLVGPFGLYVAHSSPPEENEGGRIPLYGPPSSPQESAFDFAIGPLTVVRRSRPAEDAVPPDTAEASPQREAALPLMEDVITYTVAAGDTLEALAERFGVADYTIFWVNKLRTPRDLRPGMVLTIPPLSGAPHLVQPGETLESIADIYGVRPGNIVGYPPNGLRYPYHLEVGQEIFVPGAVVDIPKRPVAEGERPKPILVQMPGGEKLRWPTWGTLTAPFGWSRAYGGYHRGIDIANQWGTPVYAAAAGTVVEAGWGSLGWYVAIDHGNGFRTEYGHLAERPWVKVGDHVEKGQRIGSMGRTYGQGGYASGVHLHFAVRHHGALIDPLPLLEH
ncbi:MAG: peptidoglycan DD-metalloendopeptidase family protein [Chloroflexia bacterium]